MPAKTKVTSSYNLEVLFPDIAAELSSLSTLPSYSIAPNSREEVEWACSTCHQTWTMKVVYRTRDGFGCTVCSGRKIVAGINDLATLFPALAEEFDRELNSPVTPEEVNFGSHKVYWWTSKECGHTWPSDVKGRTHKTRGTGCKVCTGFHIVPGVNDLASQRPELMREWDFDKNTLDPQAIGVNGAGSKMKLPRAWWLCTRHGHSWDAPIAHRSSGSGCPTCANKRVLVGFNDLLSQSPHVLPLWDFEKNERSISELVYSSKRKIFLKCDESHEWTTSAKKTINPYYGCRTCNGSAAEKEIEEFLQELGEQHSRNDRSILKSGRELDFVIPRVSLAIEYNGMYWHSEEAGTARGYHKRKYDESLKAGLNLWFIWEDEWTRDATAVKEQLRALLGRIDEPRLLAGDYVFERGSHEDVKFRLSQTWCKMKLENGPTKKIIAAKHTIWTAGDVRYSVRGDG